LKLLLYNYRLQGFLKNVKIEIREEVWPNSMHEKFPGTKNENYVGSKVISMYAFGSVTVLISESSIVI
jgi:hypothetical protein